MDDFTKRMLERAKSRREKLDTALASVGDNKRPRAPLAENNPAPIASSFEVEDKKEERHEEPRKTEVKTSESRPAAPDSGLRDHLNRLGRLYESENLDNNFSSPVHPRTETLSRFPAVENQVPRVKTAARKARLDALAQNFKEWEDDYSLLPPTPSVPAQTPLSPVRIGRAASPSRKPMGSPQRALFGSPVRAQSPIRAASPVCAIPSSPVRAASPIRHVAAPSSPAQSASPVPISPLATPVGQRGPQMGVKSAPKNVILDKSVLATLEAQGFVPTESKSCLVYNYQKGDSYNNPQGIEEEDSFTSEAATPTSGSISSPGWVYRAGSPVKPRMGVGSPIRAASPVRAMSPARAGSPVRPMSPVRPSSPARAMSPIRPGSPMRPCSPVNRPKNMSPGSVLQKAAMFESAAVAASASPTKDPAELPLSQRMALFEKNKTNAPLLPKVAFATPLPAKFIPAAKPELKPAAQVGHKLDVEKKQTDSGKDNLVRAHKAMFEKSLNQIAKPSEVVASSQSERQKELEMLRSRYDKQKQVSTKEEVEPSKEKEVAKIPPAAPPMPRQERRSPSPPKRAESPKKQYPALEEVKKIKVSPPKEGRMYPSLSDIDATESEMDADTSGSTDQSGEVEDANHSFGEEILKAAGLNNEKNSIKRAASEMTENECAVLEDMDDFLDEALGNVSDIASVGPTPPKKSRDRDEGIFRTPAAKYMPSAPDTPIPSVLVGEGMKPLIHTVSFYRKQQSQGSKLSTPVHHVYRQPEEVDEEEEDPDKVYLQISRKIKALEGSVSKQQIVISQASQALNLCRSTVEFSNSSEQVEAERLLLLATHKRQALLNEIQRLKVEGPQDSEFDVHSETGSLVISKLSLPLKREFLQRMRREENLEQYIVCLVKCQEQVLASTMLPTSSVPPKQELVRFPGTLTLENLKSNFAVTLEVYTLQARRETISHEDKYHIKKADTPKLRLTPKKHKNDNLLVMPVIQSPAGPNAVRSPSFSLAGFTVFSLRELNRTQFTLNKVPYNSSLEGHICFEMSSELHLDTEQRGFLTMFDDISGFGAWHRRWCVLDGARLAYWKYPDDEKKREPIGWVDLNDCSSKQIAPVSREICARLNTFLIETQRAALPDDKESLVMIPGKSVTTIRHLISTDSKEERIQWCKELNHAITSMRAWKSCHKAAGKGTAV